MGFEDNIKALQNRLAEVPELSDLEREVLTSKTLLKHVMPLMTAFVAEQTTQQQAIKDMTGEKLRLLAEKVLVAPVGAEDIPRYLQDLQKGVVSGDWLERAIEGLQEHWFWAPIITVIITGFQVVSLLTSYFATANERTRQIANETIRPFLLDLDSLVKEAYRNPVNIDWVREQMAKMGISEEKIDVYLSNQSVLIPLDILRVLWYREDVDDTELEERLRAMQFKGEDIEKIKTGLKVYPGIADIIRFAVREVFDPDFAEAAGFFQDMPTDYFVEAKKAGLSPEYAKMFWGAHWEPPSVGQAFEMFHRGVIPEKELKTLLRIKDIMPGYREKLLKIAYSPITRVDVRRIYDMGMLGFEELITRYQDIGYSPEDAELIAEWTEIRYGEERKERTKADILKLYKIGEFTFERAIEALSDIGYREEIAQELIYRVDLSLAEKRLKNKLKIWRKGFVNDSYTEPEVRGFMLLEQMQRPEIDDYILEWQAEKDTKIKELSLRDIKDIYLAGLLNNNEALLRLTRQGYKPEDVQLLLLLWGSKNDAKR